MTIENGNMTSWDIDFRNYGNAEVSTQPPRLVTNVNHIENRLAKLESTLSSLDELRELPKIIFEIRKAYEVVKEKSKIILGMYEEFEAKASSIRQNSVCIVCLINPRNRSLLHGSSCHTVTCSECSSRLRRCPICNLTIERVITNYHS